MDAVECGEPFVTDTRVYYTGGNPTFEWSSDPIEELKGTDDVLEYMPEGSSASMFFKVAVRLSDDY